MARFDWEIPASGTGLGHRTEAHDLPSSCSALKLATRKAGGVVEKAFRW